ncbi:unnamed protein product [Dovyalis caffra]|uniref:RCK N-terminal domain-containing protein n=1 Tax=Dovyalis caffra TaxID=77055 RepID=A0AAV1QW33_9ROSI|nr:unnamed protein product [Dovyalis caffra]
MADFVGAWSSLGLRINLQNKTKVTSFWTRNLFFPFDFMKAKMKMFLKWVFCELLQIVITALTSLVHKNFTLHNQVIDLQDQVLKLNVRLRACYLLSNVDTFDSVMQEIDDYDYGSNNGLKKLALIVSLMLLSIPVLAFKYIDFPLALLVATLLVICLGGLALFGVTDDSLADCPWLSWTFVVDLGNHANSEGIGPRPVSVSISFGGMFIFAMMLGLMIGPRLVSVSISFGGMFIFAMMLGLVFDAISEKFDSLRKGRSEVVEQNHTLILGWSDKLGSLLNQLAITNESLGGGIVVVMAERDKEEMEMDIAKMESDFKRTSIVFRSGSILILADLKKVSVCKARAIVVLADDGNADQSDARALRTILSLTGVKEGLKGHIVVELSDLNNEVLVKLVGGELVETVVAHDVIGYLMIQCAWQPGLAQVNSALLILYSHSLTSA